MGRGQEPAEIVLKDGSKRYRGRCDAGRDPVTGKRIQRTITARTKAEYWRKVREAGRSEADAGRMTVASYLEELWLPHKAASGQCRPASLREYGSHIRLHLVPAFGTSKLGRLETIAIQRWINEQTITARPQTIRTRFATLDQALRQAVRWRVIAHNPADGVLLPRVEISRKTVWTPAELDTFLDATRDDSWHALWVVLARTGLRIGEALALTWPDVDLDVPSVRVARTMTKSLDGYAVVGDAPKTDASRRDVLIDDETADVLRDLTKRSLWLFPDRRDVRRPASAKSAAYALTRACRSLGWDPITPHELRHGHGSHMAQAEVHPSLAARRLGHASLRMLDRYTHPQLADQARVLERLAATGDKVVTRLPKNRAGTG